MLENFASEVCNDFDKEGLHIAHYDLRFAKPLDHKMLHEVFENYPHVITVEDGCISGGCWIGGFRIYVRSSITILLFTDWVFLMNL